MTQKQVIFSIVTVILVAISALLFWDAAKEAFFSPAIKTVAVALAAAAFWLSLICLSFIFIRNMAVRLILGLVSPLPLFVYWAPDGLVLAGFLLIFVSFMRLSLGIQHRQKSSLRSSPGDLLSPLKTQLVFLTFSLSVLFYPNAQSQSQSFKLTIPDQIFNLILQNFGPAGDSQTSDEFLRQQFEAQKPRLRQQLLDQGLTNLDDQNREIEKLFEQTLKQAKEPLANQLPDLKSIKEMTEKQLDSFLGQYRPYLPLVLTLSLYLTLGVFIGPVYTAVLFLVQIYLLFLKLAGVVTTRKETVEVERYEV